MTDLTPRNFFPFPSNLEQPFFQSAKGFSLAVDAGIWANAENGNLTYNGGGLVSWNAPSSTLSWTMPIYLTPFTSAFQARAVIAGPPTPGGNVELNDGEVAFFTMPRLMTADTLVTLSIGTRIYQPNGTRMHDLRLFAARVGDTVLFSNGKSLKDGESAVLFGGGTGTTIPPHQHQPALLIEPPSAGVSTLDLQVTALGDERLILFGTIGIFATGDIITGSVSLTTATVSSVNPTYISITGIAGAGFEVGENITGNSTIVNIQVNAPVGVFTVGDTVTAGGATGIIEQITGITPTSFLVAVTSGIFPVSGTLTDTTSSATANITNTILIGHPTASIASIFPPSNLLRADIYRNGLLQAEGVTRDYTLNYATGIATLSRPTVTTTERFVILEEVVPSSTGTDIHQHLKLPIPIVISGTVNLDMLLTINTPSPNKLIDVYLFRNGALQAQPGDYTLDLNTGIVTLNIPANSGELFIADRLVE